MAARAAAQRRLGIDEDHQAPGAQVLEPVGDSRATRSPAVVMGGRRPDVRLARRARRRGRSISVRRRSKAVGSAGQRSASSRFQNGSGSAGSCRRIAVAQVAQVASGHARGRAPRGRAVGASSPGRPARSAQPVRGGCPCPKPYWRRNRERTAYHVPTYRRRHIACRGGVPCPADHRSPRPCPRPDPCPGRLRRLRGEQSDRAPRRVPAAAHPRSLPAGAARDQ